MKTIHHIAVVDDDSQVRNLLTRFLFLHGYVVSPASNTKHLDEILLLFQVDAIILDIMLPGESGIDYLIRNRSKIAAPVFMLTAMGEVDDRINGLEIGADDYLAKPFEPRELLLRLKKLIKNDEKGIIRFGHFIYDPHSQILTKQNKEGEDNIHLTFGEKKILSLLSKNINQTVRRTDLLHSLGENSIRSVDTQISRLRSKIEGNPKQPIYLQTIRNNGYVLRGIVELI